MSSPRSGANWLLISCSKWAMNFFFTGSLASVLCILPSLVSRLRTICSPLSPIITLAWHYSTPFCRHLQW
ncbi:hypothetical protein BJX62DRAFT_221374 [Aspergillus germanicus]